jgi:HEAT repeat protein
MTAVEARDVPGALEAYERFRDLDGPDGQLLAEVAAIILEEAALSEVEAEREAAFTQLILAGTRGLPVLRRLAEREEPAASRARALQTLALRGDASARAYLYSFVDAEDPAVLSIALGAVDAETETARLLEALRHPSAAVRKEAARALGGAAPSADARLALAEAARVDPEPSVRNAAVRALGSYGAAALDPLRDRLSDPDSSVRAAVVRALVQADRERALLIIGPLLETPPSSAGIEAARVIAFTGEASEPPPEGSGPAPGVVDARAFLLRALVASAATLRSQAAVALVSLPPSPELDRGLLDALAAETEDGVRLSMAIALLRRPGAAEAAYRALRSLLAASGMPSLQAAAVLAEDEDERDRAVPVLERALEHEQAILRRVAARALARSAMRPDAVRGALTDDDPLVRISAAGGILAAAANQ